MEQFRTTVSPIVSKGTIRQKTSFLTLGSCFSDAIGKRLQENKFPVLINPFGTIYNPLALHRLIITSITGELPSPDSFTRLEDIHLNYNFHSSFSALNHEALAGKIENTLKNTRKWLGTCDYILLTYGTAWVYILNENGLIVANCHKQTSNHFTKTLLSTDQIIDSFGEMISAIRNINREAKIILTVSPVRHTKDTLLLNGVSKAIVRTACHLLAEKFSHVEYFPAYEIMMDDLRDYRFYKSDMIHPTEQAEDYIWNHFVEHYMGATEKQFINKWKSIRTALHHKPFHAESIGHKNFLKDVLKKLEELQSIVNVDEEIRTVKEQLGISS